MSISPGNLIIGAARLQVAPVGSVEPDDSAVTGGWDQAVPGAPWTDVGATSGGTTLEIDETLTDFDVDQITMSPGSRVTEVKGSVSTKLAEMTLENLNLSLNNIATIVQGDGYRSMEIPVSAATSQPQYFAVMIDGWGPLGDTGLVCMRRVIVRKTLSQVKASLTWDKKTQQSLDCTWNTYYISDSVLPIKIIDQTDVTAAA